MNQFTQFSSHQDSKSVHEKSVARLINCSTIFVHTPSCTWEAHNRKREQHVRLLIPTGSHLYELRSVLCTVIQDARFGSYELAPSHYYRGYLFIRPSDADLRSANCGILRGYLHGDLSREHSAAFCSTQTGKICSPEMTVL